MSVKDSDQTETEILFNTNDIRKNDLGNVTSIFSKKEKKIEMPTDEEAERREALRNNMRVNAKKKEKIEKERLKANRAVLSNQDIK